MVCETKINIFIFVLLGWEVSLGQGDEDNKLARLNQPRNGNFICNGTCNDNKTSFHLLMHVSFVQPTTGVSFMLLKE